MKHKKSRFLLSLTFFLFATSIVHADEHYILKLAKHCPKVEDIHYKTVSGDRYSLYYYYAISHEGIYFQSSPGILTGGDKPLLPKKFGPWQTDFIMETLNGKPNRISCSYYSDDEPVGVSLISEKEIYA